MRVHEFDAESLPDRPWKNGRGTTREIACWPAGSDLGSFGWRVSIAAIEASGPFSTFPGVDRTILLLSGRGVRLRSSDGCIDHRLDAREQPFSFAGEAVIDCETLGTESRDFNVMTRRGVCRSETKVMRSRALLEPAPFGLLLALRGAWQLDTATACVRLDPARGLWWEEGETARWSIVPDDAHGADDAALIAVRCIGVECEPA